MDNLKKKKFFMSINDLVVLLASLAWRENY